MKKFIAKTKELLRVTIITTLIISTAIPFTSNAATINSNEKISNTGKENVIYLNNAKELKVFEQELEKHNSLVEKKWQQALRNKVSDQKVPGNGIGPMSLSAYYSTTTKISYSWGGVIGGKDYFSGYLTLIGETYKNSTGGRVFRNNANVTFTSTKTKNKVEDFSYDTELIDSGRTWAVNFSSYVTVYVSDKSSNRYPISTYVEYYSGGSCHVY